MQLFHRFDVARINSMLTEFAVTQPVSFDTEQKKFLTTSTIAVFVSGTFVRWYLTHPKLTRQLYLADRISGHFIKMKAKSRSYHRPRHSLLSLPKWQNQILFDLTVMVHSSDPNSGPHADQAYKYKIVVCDLRCRIYSRLVDHLQQHAGSVYGICHSCYHHARN